MDVSWWCDGECCLVVARSSEVGVGGRGLVTGLGVGSTCSGGERGGVLAHRLTQRERMGVVVSQQFGFVVALTGELFDPQGGGLVFLGAIGAANLGIGHVPGQGVPELELGLTVHRGAPNPLEQLFSLQAVEEVFSLPRALIGERADCANPRRLAYYRGILDQRLLLRGERI